MGVALRHREMLREIVVRGAAIRGDAVNVGATGHVRVAVRLADDVLCPSGVCGEGARHEHAEVHPRRDVLACPHLLGLHRNHGVPGREVCLPFGIEGIEGFVGAFQILAERVEGVGIPAQVHVGSAAGVDDARLVPDAVEDGRVLAPRADFAVLALGDSLVDTFCSKLEILGVMQAEASPELLVPVTDAVGIAVLVARAPRVHGAGAQAGLGFGIATSHHDADADVSQHRHRKVHQIGRGSVYVAVAGARDEVVVRAGLAQVGADHLFVECPAVLHQRQTRPREHRADISRLKAEGGFVFARLECELPLQFCDLAAEGIFEGGGESNFLRFLVVVLDDESESDRFGRLEPLAGRLGGGEGDGTEHVQLNGSEVVDAALFVIHNDLHEVHSRRESLAERQTDRFAGGQGADGTIEREFLLRRPRLFLETVHDAKADLDGPVVPGGVLQFHVEFIALVRDSCELDFRVSVSRPAYQPRPGGELILPVAVCFVEADVLFAQPPVAAGDVGEASLLDLFDLWPVQSPHPWSLYLHDAECRVLCALQEIIAHLGRVSVSLFPVVVHVIEDRLGPDEPHAGVDLLNYHVLHVGGHMPVAHMSHDQAIVFVFLQEGPEQRRVGFAHVDAEARLAPAHVNRHHVIR